MQSLLHSTEKGCIIVGLEGSDVLTGGLGTDIFRYSSNTEGGDRITDFTVSSDKIDLSEVLDNLGYTGTDALAQPAEGIADGYVQFGSRGRLGTSINLDPDGFAGSAKARSFIVVENVDVASLSNSDNFLFFDT
ncbi:MAG TPA: type I secretion C-terminal target domain-containing protein [Leptolyngbyaceae cyanobacterium]